MTSSQDLSPLKRALVELRELRAKLAAFEREKSEPLAVIGIGCRFPGGANDPRTFWELLRDGRSVTAEAPPDRWDNGDFFDPNPDAPGKIVTRRGGFLDRIDLFDADFFGITPREAVSMDPQQRLLLEVSYEALQDAAVAPEKLRGGDTGVFVGIGTSDYLQLRSRSSDLSEVDAYLATGTSHSVASGRLSYFYGFEGPCLSVDTACSSSLVAVHLAIRSLRAGECSMALVGGVSALAAPDMSVNCSRARMLAPDGRCKTFDASADGYARAEGCGVIVLKRLSDAERDGNRIYAVLRGSAVNQDGRSSGLTVPNGPAQEALIRAALKSAGAAAGDVDYVEAHGTGTPLGDPIEVQALGAAFGPDRERPLVIGSVKTNLGHLEAAAGIAGLVKVVLALAHEEIPPHLHLNVLNPRVDWSSLPLEVGVARRAWPRTHRERIAGVSSFGFSGTNAHVVIAEAPAPGLESEAADRPLHVLALSARSDAALSVVAERIAARLDESEAPSFADVAYTAATGRSHFEHRLAVVASSAADASAKLASGPERGRVLRGSAPAVVFLFTGQGSQYYGMGRTLYQSCPRFRESLERSDGILRPILGESLLDVLYDADASREHLDCTRWTQPALFALEHALAELWRSFGVEPTYVFGHSVGEYAAAVTASTFDLESGLRLVAERGRLMDGLPDGGGMAAVFAPESLVVEAAKAFPSLSVAASNGPSSVVVSGKKDELAALVSALRDRGIDSRDLNVSHAFHSSLVEPALGPFEDYVRGFRIGEPSAALVSSVTGSLVKPGEIQNPSYWRRQTRETVRFAEAVETLRSEGVSVFLEIGPSPVLCGLSSASRGELWLPSLRKGSDDWETLLSSFARLYTRGVEVSFDGLDRGYRRRSVSLPTYPFERERFWIKTAARDREAREDQWFYEVAWERAEPRNRSGSNGSGAASLGPRDFIVFSDRSGVGHRVAELARASGHRVLEIESGSDHELPLSSLEGDRPREYLYLRGLDAPSEEEVNETGFTAHETDLLAPLLSLTRVLLREPLVESRLWLVTRGTQGATSAETPGGLEGLSGAPIWGFGRVFALEHPDAWGGLIDVAGSPDEAAASLLREVETTGGEDQIAVQGSSRSVARLGRTSFQRTSRLLELHADGSYLITGGLGRLGLLFARFLAERGARHLVLLGRTGLLEPPGSDDRSRTIAEIESLGVSVEVVVGDVANVRTLDALARRLDEAGRPLRGVAHAAAVTETRSLRETTTDALRAVLEPKIGGAWALHRITETRQLDFFLLFSSSAGILGVSGLGAYAAGNQFLDALARHRRARGLPATSVSWGAWEYARWATEEARLRSREGGMLPLPASRALALVDSILLSDRAHYVVAEIDWSKLKPVYEARRKRPFLERFDVSPESPAALPLRSLREDLASAAPERRLALTDEYLERELARTLGLEGGARVDPSRPLSEMGIDSLMAVQLKNRLESHLGASVSVRSLLGGATLEELRKSVRLSVGANGESAAARLERRGEREEVLSFAQERFWFLEQLEPGSSLYANAALFRIRGALDPGALSQALDRLRERHEVLRTRFTLVDGEPRQVVMEPARFPLRVVDLVDLHRAGGEDEAMKRAREELARPFDLRTGDLVRAALFRIAADDHLLVVSMHHAISDGWSYRVFLKDLGAFYHGMPLEPLPVQYTDFARWQRRSMSGEDIERQLSYWKRQLAGSPPLLQLPTDFQRPPTQAFRGRQIDVEIEPSLKRSLEELSRREGATLFMTLLAAFGTLLHRFSGETDISIGSPIAGRHRAEIENSIGVFLNNLVFRADFSGDPTFRELLGRVRQVALDGYANQDLPFEALVSELAPERDLSKTPLFQVFFNMANLPDYRDAVAGLDIDYLFSSLAESRFDLTLYAVEGRRASHLVLVFNADLFEEATARQLLASLHRLLHAISGNAEERISRVPLLPEGALETQRAAPPPSLRAGEGFQPFAEGASGETVASRFRRMARENADRLAVWTSTRRLSYRDLDRWTNGAAQEVRKACPAREDRVALLLGHDLSMVASVMGAVKAGRTYVPLDPSYPPERLSKILEDSGARALLTESENLSLARELSGNGVAVLDVDAVAPEADGPAEDERPEAVAYILYTSGSTGEPKGVMQSYRNLLHHASVYCDNLLIGSGDRVLLLASYTFDAAVMDLYGALLSGAALFPYDLHRQGVESLGSFLDREGITLYHSTPTVFRHFLGRSEGGSRHPSIRAVVLGGEEVHRADVERFRASFSSSAVLVNGLGPTESTLTLQFFVGPETEVKRTRVPVGFPVTGTEVLLLSESGAAGQVCGEIAIRSPFVALGYFRREELTRAAFSGPSNGDGARVYRTGDMGRLLPDGSVEFLGRRGSRVKVRGFRIELEEVEAHLERHPDVREAAVIDRNGNGGDGVLAAFLVMRDGCPVDTAGLRRFLAESLPGFMVPARFQMISRIPMTGTGKIDRRALRLLNLVESEGEATEPRTPTEDALAAIWRKLLRVERVGRGDNFFELGGHSLLATRLSLAVHEGLGVDLPLKNLFSTPSVAEMASFIDAERQKNGSPRGKTPILRLSRDAHRLPAGSRDPAAMRELMKRKS